MKPEHKKYILENIEKKTITEIARELDLKERKIKKFLSQENIKTKGNFKWRRIIKAAAITS